MIGIMGMMGFRYSAWQPGTHPKRQNEEGSAGWAAVCRRLKEG